MTDVERMYAALRENPVDQLKRRALADALAESDDPAERALSDGYRMMAACGWTACDAVGGEQISPREWWPDAPTCWFAKELAVPHGRCLADRRWSLPDDVFKAAVTAAETATGKSSRMPEFWTPNFPDMRTAEDFLAGVLSALPQPRREQLMRGEAFPNEVK